MFVDLVERWRPAAQRQAGKLPVAWILATIQRESGGQPGARGHAGDYGLMQTKPATISSYNAANPRTPVEMSEILGTSEADGEKQIAVGAWYLRRCASAINELDSTRFPWPAASPTDDQIRYADLCYSAGVQGFLNYRTAALGAGVPDTFERLASFAPGVGRWQIPPRKFGHARAVLALTLSDGASSGTPGPRPSTSGPVSKRANREDSTGASAGGFALLALLGLLALGAGSRNASLDTSTA